MINFSSCFLKKNLISPKYLKYCLELDLFHFFHIHFGLLVPSSLLTFISLFCLDIFFFSILFQFFSIQSRSHFGFLPNFFYLLWSDLYRKLLPRRKKLRKTFRIKMNSLYHISSKMLHFGGKKQKRGGLAGI